MTTFRLGRIFVARSRGHYVVFGASATYDQRFHGRLAGSPDFYSQASATRWVQAETEAGRIRVGMTASGHHAGAERCGSDCDRRFVYEFDLHAATQALRNGGAAIAPPARPALSVPDSLRARVPPRSTIAGVRSFGVELECSVPRENRQMLRDLVAMVPRMEQHGDGSVRANPGGEADELTFWASSFEEMEAWLRVMYEQVGVTTNSSCGFHVHVRPDSSLVGEFRTKRYWDGFYQAYRAMAAERGARYAERMNENGPGHWCRMVPWSPSEAQQTSDRYRAINLLSIERHGIGAVEHRILPGARTASEAVESVRWLVGTASGLISQDYETEEFVITVRAPARARPVSVEVQMTDGTVQQLSDITVAPVPASVEETAEMGRVEV